MVDRAGRRFCDDSYWVSIVSQRDRPRRPPPALLHDLGRGPSPALRDGQHAPGRGLPAGSRRRRRLAGASSAASSGSTAPSSSAPWRASTRAPRAARIPSSAAAASRSFAPTPATPTTSPTRCWRRWPTLPTSACGCTSSEPDIGSSGVRIDGDGHVLTRDRQAIPGLHAIGSCARPDPVGDRVQQRLRAGTRNHPGLPGCSRADRISHPGRGRDAAGGNGLNAPVRGPQTP